MPTSGENKIYEAMGADPEPHDENDPAYKLEQFQILKGRGKKPEDIWNEPEFAKEYGEWLAKNP
jgi:hypothetical protein